MNKSSLLSISLWSGGKVGGWGAEAGGQWGMMRVLPRAALSGRKEVFRWRQAMERAGGRGLRY